jgi:hypothetical protein
MASITPRFGFAIFDFGDTLDAPLNVQREIDRFLVLDKQLYAIFKVFGSGVIDGWTVTDNGFTPENGISVAISPGIGIIRYIASETTFPSVVDGLPPNSLIDIYAVLRGSTAVSRDVDFTYSTVPMGNFAILLAQVQTGNNGIQFINNSVRKLIGFEEIIREEIDAHKHRGTPSKIDLQTETKNQLPGAKIESVDTEKMTSGIVDPERIPQLNHDDLRFNGLLTHAMLDSFVKSLKENNKELLGEVASTNLMKHIAFTKYKYSDIDRYMVNQLAIIPGISPEEFIDLEATTAQVNFDSKCISGKPPAVGEFVDVSWDSESSFTNAFKKVNVTVEGDKVILLRDEDARETIENFENVASSGSEIPGFSNTMSVLVDNLKITAEAATTLKMDGFYSGKVTSNRTLRALFTKTFTTARDWSAFDELVVNVKTLTASHGPVYCYFVNGTGDNAVLSESFLILSNDETTENPESTLNNFEQRSFSIGNAQRNNVTSFVVYTDDTSAGFEFYLDDVHVQNTALFKPQGTINFRFSSSAAVTFYSVFYDADLPTGTSVRVRVRSSSSTSLLPRASYTLPVKSGDAVALPGTDAEIEVTLLTDDKTKTPVLRSVKLRMLVKSEQHGFDIRDESSWSLGDLKNISIEDSGGGYSQIEIKDPINVGGISFSYLQAIREIDDNNVAVTGFSGVKMPISPFQALSWAVSPLKRFNGAVSVERQIDKTYIVCDMENDRVLLLDANGVLVKGFGSVNESDTDFYPFTACYNPNNGVLSVVLSRAIDSGSVVLSSISLYLGTTQIKLGSSDTVQSTNKSAQILEIVLSDDKQSQLENFTGSVTVDFRNGSFPQSISSNKNAQALIGLRGISCFIGDFTFIDGIRHPVHASILDNGNWIIANSSVEYENATDEAGTISSLKSLPNSVSVTISSQASFKITGGLAPYSIQTGPNTSIAQSTLSGVTVSVTGVAAGSTSITIKDSSPSPLTLVVPVTVVVGAVTSTTTSNPSLFEFKPLTQEIVFTSSKVLFSDFSLGGITEQDNDRIVVAGIYKDPASLTNTNTGVQGNTSTSPSVDTTLTDAERFRLAAVDALSEYRGVVAVIDKPSNNLIFQYFSPDGLYASDVDVNEDGNFVVAESSFSGSGRVVVLDSFGNIIRIYGNGMFNAVNDAKSVGNGHILVSV